MDSNTDFSVSQFIASDWVVPENTAVYTDAGSGSHSIPIPHKKNDPSHQFPVLVATSVQQSVDLVAADVFVGIPVYPEICLQMSDYCLYGTERNEFLPSVACVVTLVDRLVHHSEVVQIKGQSYRLKEARERFAQRAEERKRRQRDSAQNDPHS